MGLPGIVVLFQLILSTSCVVDLVSADANLITPTATPQTSEDTENIFDIADPIQWPQPSNLASEVFSLPMNEFGNGGHGGASYSAMESNAGKGGKSKPRSSKASRTNTSRSPNSSHSSKAAKNRKDHDKQTRKATSKPTPQSIPKPTTTRPTNVPTSPSTNKPTNAPTSANPTKITTSLPTNAPTSPSTNVPTNAPTTSSPTSALTTLPTNTPTPPPSNNSTPTESPTKTPTQPPTSNSTSLLVQSPSCIEGYICLQNHNFGVQDNSKYNIDMVLEVTNASHTDAFVDAWTRWMEVIVGDLPGAQSSQIPANSRYDCVNDPPTRIDDTIICGQHKPIDGQGKVLGSANPLVIRQSTATQKWTTFSGFMRFDIADIDGLIGGGTYDSLILHEMGHVFGIGGLWKRNGLIDGNFTYLGENAIRVWKNDWGCVTNAPPVDTDGRHWDAVCLTNELLMGFDSAARVSSPLSNLTIATLEDSGYTVDYSVADQYNGSNTNTTSGCCLSPSFLLNPDEGDATEAPTPPLSDAGRADAVAYGLDILKENELPSSFVEVDGLQYVGDLFTTVLYEENGHIYEVDVTNE